MTSSSIDLSAATWFKSSYSNGSGGDCLEIGRDFPGAASWRKSTHSNGSGGNCLEVAVDLPGNAQWRKSTHSNGDGGHCVEVSDAQHAHPGVVPVRDSKAAPQGPVLTFPAPSWNRFIAGVKGGAFVL
ncbi:DUF397 domain-containing protein [Streptomyces daliensis]|uniref:DUF397 domain-containing protein n=1 Tax=Streptomyces daliensis TaxID=299421 RepID=A0A8T4J0S4_9ACTN|nr:DUF397 domain-containing protein [Streptomyces daliensis]